MITFDSVVTFSLGSIVGFIASELIKDRLARNRNIETLQIAEFNKGAAAFRSAFVDAIVLLRENIKTGDKMIGAILTEPITVSHEKAKIMFEPLLNRAELNGFNTTWEKYQNYEHDYFVSHPGQPPVTSATKKEYSQYCLDCIRELLSHAQPKIKIL